MKKTPCQCQITRSKIKATCDFIKINIICQYLCSWMLTNPKTSTEWGTYSFSHLQHASKCSHYKIRNLSLHTLAGTWAVQKNGFDGPLQNEEPATNLEVFSTKSGHPTPVFLVHSYDFQKYWPLQSGESDMSKHLSRIATWKKENRQKYKDPFCRGMM